MNTCYYDLSCFFRLVYFFYCLLISESIHKSKHSILKLGWWHMVNPFSQHYIVINLASKSTNILIINYFNLFCLLNLYFSFGFLFYLFFVILFFSIHIHFLLILNLIFFSILPTIFILFNVKSNFNSQLHNPHPYLPILVLLYYYLLLQIPV